MYHNFFICGPILVIKVSKFRVFTAKFNGIEDIFVHDRTLDVRSFFYWERQRGRDRERTIIHGERLVEASCWLIMFGYSGSDFKIHLPYFIFRWPELHHTCVSVKNWTSNKWKNIKIIRYVILASIRLINSQLNNFRSVTELYRNVCGETIILCGLSVKYPIQTLYQYIRL